VVAALEPEISRQHSVKGGPIDRTQLLTLFVVALAVGLITLGALALFAEDLHVNSRLVALCVVGSTVMFPSMFVARGFLAGSLRFLGLAGLTAIEAGLRLGAVALGLVLGHPAVPTFAVAAMVSSLVGLPILVRNSRWVTGSLRLLPSLRRTAILMAGNAMAALLVTGAPVLVGLAMADSPAEETGRMQSAVVVSRFPLMALLLLQSLLIPIFTRRQSLYDRKDYLIVVSALLLAFPLAGLAAYTVGPVVLSTLYGPDYQIGVGQITLLTLGACAVGGIQVLIALAVSSDRHRLAVFSLLPSLVVTSIVAFAGTLPPATRVPVALAVGPMVGFAVALLITSGWGRRSWTTHRDLPVALGDSIGR
jgi:hypothetical protein